MEHRIRLPGTGLDVSRLCLGGNRFGGELNLSESFALLDAYVEGGGNFIDTAHVYADWIPGNERSSSEKTLGRWLRSRRPSGIVIATKGGFSLADNQGETRLGAQPLRQDVEQSLANLGAASLDIFYVHRDDPRLPVEEILNTLETLRRESLIRHYAASNWSAARLREAHAVSRRKGWPGFIANQPEWSLAKRNAETAPDDLRAMDAEMFAFHESSGLAAVPYSSQAKGYFDKADGARSDQVERLYGSAQNRALAKELSLRAKKIGATPTQVMLAALIRAPFPVVPVVGCRTPEQVRSSLASLAIDLPAEAAISMLNPAATPGTG